MHALKLYGRYMATSVRSQLQYRASFLMQTAGHLLITAGEFIAIWALFARFGSLLSWNLSEVAVFYGVVSITFAIADAITTGFDNLGTLVRTGRFDRYLLRPRGVVLQLLGFEFTLRRAGRFLQSIVVLVYGLTYAGAMNLAPLLLLLIWTSAGAVAFFVALMILQATLAFRTVEALEIMNVFTYGGTEAAQYPFSIYARWFRRFFTVVIPLAAVSYYPVVTMLGRADAHSAPLWVGWLTPAAGLAFLAAALAVWNAGVRWYQSTGS